jgi:hypothetical protein
MWSRSGAGEVLGRSTVADLAPRFPSGVDTVLDAAAFGEEAIRGARDGGTFVSVMTSRPGFLSSGRQIACGDGDRGLPLWA